MKIRKKIIAVFSSYCPLQISPLKTCIKYILETIIASSFKLGQLIKNNHRGREFDPGPVPYFRRD